MMEGYQFPKQLDEALGPRDNFEFRWAPKFFLDGICPLSYFADSLRSICCFLRWGYLRRKTVSREKKSQKYSRCSCALEFWPKRTHVFDGRKIGRNSQFAQKVILIWSYPQKTPNLLSLHFLL